jgi:oligopeptide/dipeptide ABC transporter ATP-binding protein
MTRLLARLPSLMRRRPLEAIGVGLAAIAIVAALIGPELAPHDPYRVDYSIALLPPGGDYWLGTDPVGRDVFTRLLFGARLSLTAVVGVLALALIIGTIVGTSAALAGGWLDEGLMRITDVALSFPALLLALGITAVLGVSLQTAIIALALATWPGYARLVRSLVLETLEKEFVESARAIGASPARVLLRHILPNSLQTLYVQVTLDVPMVVLMLAGLAFIGVGAQPPFADWGAMIAGGREYILSAPWVVLFPGIAILATAIGFGLLGDLLRSELDPTVRTRRSVQSRRVSSAAPAPTASTLPRPDPGPLLSIRGLRITFQTEDGPVLAVNGLDLDVGVGQRVGLVGESGSGKTATAMSILGLHTRARIEGEIRFAGTDLLRVSSRQLRDFRGTRIGLIMQDSLSSLNPSMSVGDQITEPMIVRGMPKADARRRAEELLESVGIANAHARFRDYPHQFSGGMRQRVMIAIALSGEPELLIADEPTSALDVRVQGQFLDLLDTLTRDREMAVLLISHDMGVVAGFVDRTIVMYAGRAIEEHSTDGLFKEATHPYTWGLLGSVPRLDAVEDSRLVAIRGQPPAITAVPPGCPFHPRCDHAQDLCAIEVPRLMVHPNDDHPCACHFAGDLPRPDHILGHRA